MKHYAFYFFQGGVCGSRKTRWIRCNVPGRFYKTQMDLWLNAMCWPKNGGRKTFSCTSLRLLNHFTLPNHDFYGKVISTVLCSCHSNKIALAEHLHSVISQDFPKRGFNFFWWTLLFRIYWKWNAFESRFNKRAVLFGVQTNADGHSYKKMTNNIAFCNCTVILPCLNFSCARRS